MSDVVFILGAGASVQSGAPTMATFLDTASDLLLANRLPKDRKRAFEFVFSMIGNLHLVHSKSQIDLNNIESIFTALELGKIIQRVPGLKSVEEIEEAIAALKQLIVVTLEQTMNFEFSREGLQSAKPYGDMVRLLSDLRRGTNVKRSSSVITFNYDIAMDVAMQRGQLGPDYIIEPAPGTDRRDQVPLLKLHGSLNWASEAGSRRIVPMHFVEYLSNTSPSTPSRHTAQIPIGTNITSYFERFHAQVSVLPDAVIVPPSWNKADYHQALTDVWSAAADHLAEAEYIFICGYSLPETDSFFRHLFALGSVGRRPLRRISVFNPDEAVDSRFRSMLGPGAMSRYEFHPKTFGEAIGEIRKILDVKVSHE